MFPKHSFIFGGPPQHQHVPPSKDFLFADLCIQCGFKFISKTNKVVASEAGSKQDFCIEMLAAKLKRVVRKDEENVRACADSKLVAAAQHERSC